MKKCYIFLYVFGILHFNSAFSYEADTQLSLERAGRLLASSYMTGNPDKKLFGLHKDYLPKRPGDMIHPNKIISISVEHSIQETKETPVYIKGFSQYEKWLLNVRKQFRFPSNLDVRTMGSCIDGCCKYSLDGGISHNHLYLKTACFYLENNTPYLKSITLLDSD